MPRQQDFEDALDDLLSKYRDLPRDGLISAVELKLYALKEDSDDPEE